MIEYFKILCVRDYIQTKANFDKVFKSGGFEELEVKKLVGFQGVFYKFQGSGTLLIFSLFLHYKKIVLIISNYTSVKAPHLIKTRLK